MEFYKEGKVIRITNGQTVDLGSGFYNHKGANIVEITENGAGSVGATAGVWFYNKGALSNKTIYPLTDQSSIAGPTIFTNLLIPARLAKIENQSGYDFNLILFN